MKYLPLGGLCCFVLAALPVLADQIVINEIMYHPSPAAPEDKRREWIELYNPGTNSVDLSGWHFTAGIDFTFAPNTVLQSGAYLVIAANRTAFQVQYPNVANVVGDWVGQLSNTGETIELVDALGESVASVEYADSGDWSVRQRISDPTGGQPSWEWLTLPDGQGPSLELINPALPNSPGQNWARSQSFGGTPGAANSVRSDNVAPLILGVSHQPAIPRSTDNVTITARLVDEQTNGVSATLFYRDATTTTPPAFSSAPMFDDGAHGDGLAGDGLFGAVLTPRANGTVIEFYVQSSDGTRTRTWPAPAIELGGTSGQFANAQYQVDDEAYAGDQPILRLILTGTERQARADLDRSSTGSDAQQNATLVSVDGVETQIRYLCDMRIRGAGSRSRPTKNYRVNIPSDRTWNGKTAINLNSQYIHAQIVGSVVAQKAGLPAANARVIQLRVNGVNLTRSGPPTGGDGASWGSYLLVEPINNEWAGRIFPNDPGGNVYRASSGNHRATLSYLGNSSGPYISAGYSKTANGSDDDWTDLFNLTDILNNTPDATYTSTVTNRLNLREWMTYFAVFSLMEYTETALGSGDGDDYSLYRGLVDQHFKVVGHDFDTIFGQGDTAGNLNENIFVAADPNDLPAIVRFLHWPEFAPVYFETLYRLANSNFTPEQINPIFDQYLGTLVTQPTLDAMKNFNASRRLNVLNQIPQAIRINTGLPVINGYPQTTTPAISLSGSANAIRTRTVTVNGQPANYTPWQGAWNVAGVNLSPGINRVLVQTFDATGAEVERGTIDIWYDDGTVQSIAGALAGDTTWTAAAGPYQVTGNLTVNAGVTLTIEAGATVLLGSGVNITVANGGRILANGTDTARVRFTRVPGTANWGGITINGGASSPESRFAYAHFEFNNSTAIHSTDGTLFLDHLTFGNTAVQYVSLDRSSFVVNECVFPSATAQFELVHGTGGIKAGGRGIFTRNFFGKPIAYNDVVDFTGGNRPGPIVQFVNNVFTGSDDDILDLDSTDAWIEGNIFLHAHKNNSPDSSSAISGGADNADTSQITIIGNLIYDCDQAANGKQGNFYTLINNTIVRQSRQGGVDTDAGVITLADEGTVEGAGMFLEGNIIYDAEKLVRLGNPALITFTNNLMSLPWGGPGGGNQTNLPPLFQHTPQVSETTNFTTWAQAQIMRDWLSLQPGSPARGAGPNGRDQGGVIPLGVSISGEPNGTTVQTTATLTIGLNRAVGSASPGTAAGFPEGSGYTHYRWRLDGGAWSAETPIATPISLDNLTDGPHYVEATGRRDSGFYQDDPVFGADAVLTRSRTWTVSTSSGGVRLNEILARNDTAVPHEGTFPDMVELYNNSSASVDLSGWGLTDDPVNNFKFKFPANTMLAAGGYLVLYADDSPTNSGIHLGFALNQEADALYLYSPAATLMDSVEFGIQLPDLSIGRGDDGQWTLCSPTLGAANQRYPLADPHALKINEWLANGQTLYPDDFIEIYNPIPLPVLLGGLYLTDEPLGWPNRHRVFPLTFAAAGAHFVFKADGHTADGPDHVDFKLSADQGAIGLFDTATNLIDCISYGPQLSDISEGRQPSGASRIGRFNVPTPGGPNPGAPGSSTTISNIVINIFGVTDKQWRYDAAGVDRGTSWRAPAYNDAGWSTGFGMFGFETTPGIYPYPFQTSIPAPNQAGGVLTVYYRTHFQWPPAGITNVQGFSLVVTSYVDDGAVFYLNGSEANRLRIIDNPVQFSSTANSVAEPALDVFNVSSTFLVNGDNVLAVEVHQQSCCGAGASSDDVFGMSLSAVKSQTNVTVFGLVLNEVLARNVSFTNANAGGSNAADWIELYNPSTNAFDLSGLSVSDHTDQPRRWVFPAGASIPGGGYLVVHCDGNLPPSTNLDAVLNTGFSLDGNGGDAVYVFDTLARGGAVLDSVLFGLQVPDFSIGRPPNGVGGWRLSLPTPGAANIEASLGSSAGLKVNEWLANPSGNDQDFIELYNPSAQPVNLSGLYLSDSFTNRTASRIQALSFIGTGDDAFALFIADGNTDNGADHVGFNLRGSGESVALFSANGTLIDGYTFSAQENGVSEGRFPDGSTNIVRFRGTDTPGRSNLLPIDNVTINEVLTHTDLPFEDAIELVNISATAVDISGWFLSDRRTDPKRFRIPNGTVLPPGGFVVFYEAQFNPDFSGRPPFFALSSSEGEELFLFTADTVGNLTGYRTGVKFGAAENAVSLGRYATSVGFDFTALSRRTLGADNPATVEQFRTGTGATNAYPLVGPVVISEIMYHPPDIISGTATNDNDLDEFIELQNISALAVSLFHTNYPTNTWRLRDAVDFDFPANVSLSAGARLLVVGFDPATNATALAAFRAKFGIAGSVPIYGPWRGKLANDSENLEFYKPDAPQAAGLPDAGFVPYILVDKVKYSDSAPWPALADGNTNRVGLSLQRRVASDYGNDPVNWIAGVPTPGAATGPAALTLPSISSITPPHSVPLGGSDSLTVAATGGGTLSYQWYLNGAVIPGATATTLFLNNFQATSAGVYSVLVVNGAGAASAATLVDLRSAPVIARQPQDQIAATNGTAIFSVIAGGTPPLGYQWRKNEVDIPGAHSAVLTITNVQISDAAGYRVVIANAFGSITSSVATLTILSPPMIVSQPQSTNVLVSQSATFRVSVVGSPPLRYQWRFNGVNIAGATNSTLALANLQLTNSGTFSVRVTNNIGSVISDGALLTVSPAPTVSIVATDASASEPAGNPGQFTLTRSGAPTGPLVVSFAVTGNALPGSDYVALTSPVTIPAGASSTTLPVVVLDDAVREGNETVVVTVLDGAEYVAGSPASATVVITDDDNQAPFVTLTNPAPGLVLDFPASILLGAIGSDPDGTLTKVEFFDNGTNKLGEDTLAPFSFTWTNAAVGVHVLTAVATDNLGSTGVSPPVSILVNARPTVTITSPSGGAIISIGSDITVAANAADADGTVTLVEFFEGSNLLVADSSGPYSFLWTNVPAGEYVLTARATDDRGSMSVSAPVFITVGTPVPRFADNFASRGVVSGFTNTLNATNTTYTREPGEPRHDNRSGTHSAWLSWTAPASGVCQMDTLGSSFDTVLAVYTGTVVSNLTKIVSNDDVDQDTTQSSLSFNATNGVTYQIAVDGFSSNAFGTIVFTMRMPNPYPIILVQPLGQTVNQGTNVSFNVTAHSPTAATYRWRLNGANITGATNATLVRNNVQAANAGTYTVVVSNASGSVTSAPAVLVVRTAPAITTQPASQTVVSNSSVIFSVRATGWAPLGFQWYYNGTAISGATSSNLFLPSVLGRDEGAYSVVVSNFLGTVTSRDALLTVDDGLVFNVYSELLDFTNSWRYEASGQNLSNAWRFPDYDDSGWSNGVALFGLEEPGIYPIPILTPLSLTATNGSFIVTFYFRTPFVLPDSPANFSGLLAVAFVDDGAVWYLNGREGARLRIGGNAPVDGVTNSVLGQSPSVEGQAVGVLLPLTNVVAGENLLSVEVHQSSIGSSDVIFGMNLYSFITVTNQPVLLTPQPQPGGYVITLTGIYGRNYALDVSTNLMNWTELVTWTNFTGSAQYPESSPGPGANRFYRGRLVR